MFISKLSSNWFKYKISSGSGAAILTAKLCKTAHEYMMLAAFTGS